VTRGTTICCSAVALIATAAGASSPAIDSSATRASEPFALVPTQTAWTLALNNQITVAPAYDGPRAYFSIEHDRLVAYDIVSGRQLWLVSARPTLAPATGADLVFTSEPDAIVARRAADGSVAWTIPLAGPLAVPLAFDHGWLVAALQTGTVIALRAGDGGTVWTRDLGSAAHGRPAFAEDRVYVPVENGRVVALDVATGAQVWERRVGGQPNEILAVDSRLYVGSTDNYLYCLLSKGGVIDWRWRTGGDVIGRPAADERRVYFVSLDNVLRSLDRTSGGQRWMRGLPLRPTSGPVIAGTTIVVAGLGTAVKTYNLSDGTPATDLSAGGDVAAPPYALEHPVKKLPMLLVVSRDLVKGATATLAIRSLDPPSSPVAPLPNLVTPGPSTPPSPATAETTRRGA
jgi:outer membrane protein assembly factor BamB